MHVYTHRMPETSTPPATKKGLSRHPIYLVTPSSSRGVNTLQAAYAVATMSEHMYKRLGVS